MVDTVFEPLPWFGGDVRSRYHSFEDHNFWIERNGTCPYCLSGSKAVPKILIKERMERK